MPNTFAYLALLFWPLLVIALFRKLPLPHALAWSIVGGFLFLPTRAEFNFPGIPAFDKNSLPSLAAALMCLIYLKRQVRSPQAGYAAPASELGTSRIAGKARKSTIRRKRYFGEIGIFVLILLLLFNPFLTYMTNSEPVTAGPRFIGGLTLYDAIATSGNSLVMLVPFLLGRRFLSTSDAHRILLTVLVAAGVVYSFLVLWEARMSPRLNIWIYGFFPHDWVQHRRGGGYRSIGFLEHGLSVGIFLVAALISACALWRTRTGNQVVQRRWKFFAFFIALALAMSLNFGAALLGVILAPMVLVLSKQRATFVAACAFIVVLSYPVLRANDWMPIERSVEVARTLSAERAGSLEFRFEHERRLLQRASEKPWSGWGGYDRWRVYDNVTGRSLSVSDGLWVIILGTSGWLGYLTVFGLLGMPLILLWQWNKRDQLPQETIGLMMIMAAVLLYSIPNAFVGPIFWLVAGALAGNFRRLASAHRQEAKTR